LQVAGWNSSNEMFEELELNAEDGDDMNHWLWTAQYNLREGDKWPRDDLESAR
jgi:hypothetical protein